MNEEQKEVSKHYSNVWEINLTDEERQTGVAKRTLDPYRILKIIPLGNSAVEHIFKKSIRWVAKGATPRKVLNEIIATAQRELQIMDEDEFNPNPTLLGLTKGLKLPKMEDVIKDMEFTKIDGDKLSYESETPNPMLKDMEIKS